MFVHNNNNGSNSNSRSSRSSSTRRRRWLMIVVVVAHAIHSTLRCHIDHGALFRRMPYSVLLGCSHVRCACYTLGSPLFSCRVSHVAMFALFALGVVHVARWGLSIVHFWGCPCCICWPSSCCCSCCSCCSWLCCCGSSCSFYPLQRCVH